MIQDIKIALGYYIRSMGYRTGDPRASYYCALDIFVNLVDHDYLGNISFGEGSCWLCNWACQSCTMAPPDADPAVVEMAYTREFEYCHPEFFDQLTAALQAITNQHLRYVLFNQPARLKIGVTEMPLKNAVLTAGDRVIIITNNGRQDPDHPRTYTLKERKFQDDGFQWSLKEIHGYFPARELQLVPETRK